MNLRLRAWCVEQAAQAFAEATAGHILLDEWRCRRALVRLVVALTIGAVFTRPAT